MQKLTTKQLANYCQKVDKQSPDDCWEWTAGRVSAGYGTMWLQGKMRRANRIAYFLKTGKWPALLHVLHSCDNPACCNPAHLRLGTHNDNMTDMSARGRIPFGADHYNAKLTEKEVLEIREELKNPYRGQVTALAKKYKVSQPVISRVKTRKIWGAHLNA